MWEDVYRGYDDLDSLVERVRSQTKVTRKRKRDKSYDDDEDDDAEIEVFTRYGRTNTFPADSRDRKPKK